jgi:hypothetical protein
MERDSFVIANWVHTFSAKALVSAAPYYHWNQSDYDSNPADLPVATTWNQNSNYAGAQADTRFDVGPNAFLNSFSSGLYSFYQHENDLFGVKVNDGSAASEPNTPANANAGLFEFYVGDHLRLGQYVTLLGGERFSIYRAWLNETATYPRIGATVRIPRLNWVLRGFYGHFFQPAPILTVSSAVLDYAASLGGGENYFSPIPSERDEEHQFGIEIPYRGWRLDVDTFKNRVNNFLDHSNLGESNMYFPIAVGDDPALARVVAARTVLRDLLEPDCAAARKYRRRIHMQQFERPGVRPGTAVHCARPRPAQHAEHGIHGEPSAENAVCEQCVLRVGLLEWAGRGARGAVQRAIFAGAYNVRLVDRPRVRRAMEAVGNGHQCDQPPRAAG